MSGKGIGCFGVFYDARGISQLGETSVKLMCFVSQGKALEPVPRKVTERAMRKKGERSTSGISVVSFWCLQNFVFDVIKKC